MSQRRRPTSEGASAVLSLREYVALSASAAGGTGAETARTSTAGNWVRRAPEVPLSEWARRWGLPTPGPLPAAGTAPAAGAALLSALLAGRKENLTAVPPEFPTFVDTALDASQRQAVARALATPDVCLLQGLPGSGRSRVLAEILTQLADRGQRVLLLAPTAAALDRVLEFLPAAVAQQALRWCAPEEHPEQLPPAAQAQTLPAWQRRLREHLLPQLRSAWAAATNRQEQRRTEAAVWQELLELVQEQARLEQQVRLLQEQQGAIPAQVAQQVQQVLASEEAFADATGSAAEWQERLRHCQRTYRLQEQQLQARQQQLRELLQHHQERLRELRARQQTLAPRAQAWQQRRWWSWHWWRALCCRMWRSQWQTLEKEVENLEGILATLQAEGRDLEAALAQLAARFAEDCQQQQQAEIARRQAALQEEEAAVRRRLDQLAAQVEQQGSQLFREHPRPSGRWLDLVPAAYQAWQERCLQEAAADELAGQALAYVESLLAQEADDWLARVPLLVAPLSLLRTAAWLRLAGIWDMVLLEEADCLSQAELLEAAGAGRRCLLMGSPAPEALWPRPGTGIPAPTTRTPFARLWEALHADPRRLPLAWVREGERLCCRLQAVPAEDRRYLEREPVADFPDIELRIWAPPGVPPRLAEVVFPCTLSLPQAKQYLYRELEKVLIQAQGCNAFWQEQSAGWRFWIGPEPPSGVQAVDLAEGVREWLGDWPGLSEGEAARGQPVGLSWAVDFARDQGWEWTRCADWVQQHLHLWDWGRTFYLDRLHRPRGPLAAILAELLGQPDNAAGGKGGGCLPALEFLPVPARAPRHRRSPEASRRPGSPTTGAGLEVDLSVPREAARLPAELRARLPEKGLVNYPEAQALVRYVQRLLEDPCLRALPAPRTVAVLAFQPAQVALLRALLADNALLGRTDIEVTADTPEAWRQRECAVAVLSLTRSRRQPALLSTSVEQWLLALTRPRFRLCLVGDAGMLCQQVWEPSVLSQSPVAFLEAQLAQGLRRYLHGQGRFPEAFRLRTDCQAS